MAEIKNNFLSSKMNQDIDDRLMPNNEYRYALNLEVNRSEASDVGTLQNILGNSLALDFRALTNVNNLECIGVLTDDSNDNIYVFLTNYTGTTYSSTAKNYIYVYNNKQLTNTRLVEGAFLNFSTQFPIYGINIIENLLFWTDNRNQPRKINVLKANPNNLATPTYYTNEEQISVAKLSPLDAPELFRLSEVAPGEYETTMYDVTSPELPNGVTNPYLIEDWAGDPAYLESRYVRFSYRYKFEDGEYSIMAPFTQIAYIPKQDGYFLYNASSPAINDEESAYRSTIVSFMQNKVNNILLQIKLPYKQVPVIVPPATVPEFIPCPANELYSRYKIVEIEILYKEADDIAVSAVDSIPTIPDPSRGSGYFWNTTNGTYTYDYQSKKPFKTLPSRDVIRVYDTTPVKALSQEIVGNRVVYGNYQDKYSYPKYLDYNVGASTKLPFGFDADQGTSIIEYPNHSVKENRNYQVGIVLSDKFGRQSGVILSDTVSSDESGTFGASSLYLPYSNTTDVIPSEWPGNSLKILFNQAIQPDAPSGGWPGIYNGDTTSANYNPLGWYSYKVVVKQTEQDYYNVYLPGVMAAYPSNTTLELGKTSHTVLLNDNINKVPRDLSEVGPGQKQFRSSVILYPRVNNNTELYHNEQYDPGNTYAFVNTIATNNSLFFIDGVVPSPSTIPPGFQNFYQISSDPLIARISTPAELGVVTANTGETVINLAVYETKPVESKLDIYWETSTAGLISELNTAIKEGAAYSIETLANWNFSLSEAAAPSTIVANGFYFNDILGNKISPTSVVIESVITVSNNNVTNKFTVERIGTSDDYRIKTATDKYFYYGYDATTAENYTFNIRATIGSPPVSQLFALSQNQLANVAPTITNKPTSPISKSTGDIDVYDFNGVNGSNTSGPYSGDGLTWSVTGNPEFSITSMGLLRNEAGTAEGDYTLTVKLTDPAGATDTVVVNVSYPVIKSVTFSNIYDFQYENNGTYTVSGTVTIVGASVDFYSYAESFVGGTPDNATTSYVVVNGVGNTANAPAGGTDDVFVVTLAPGIYSYYVDVNVYGSTNEGSGGLRFVQN